MLEQELKLSVEGKFAPSFPPEGTDVARVEELPALDLRATYYDTEDLRLARNGVTLRCRTGENGGSEWTLKLPVGKGIAEGREELRFDGGSRRVPAPVLDVVRALARTTNLVPVARLRTRRRRWLLHGAGGEELAELVDDRVSVLQEGRIVERFREVEIEGRSAGREALERIAGVLAQNGVAKAAQVPKVVRALGARATAPSDVPAPEQPGPAAPAADAVRAAIAAGVRRMILNDPRTRLGEMEPLHQMRVGTRRLRSDLRTFAPLLDAEWADSLRAELKWLGASLGDVRDLDVLLARLHAEGEDLSPDLDPLLEELERRRDQARAAMKVDLASQRYLDLLDRLVEAARAPRVNEAAAEPCSQVLPPLAARAWKMARKAGRAVGEQSTDEEFHRVRVRAKRARYAAEAVAPALAGGPGRLARRAARVQDVLGELQDSVVAAEAIEEFARARPDNGALNVAAGRMLERESRARVRARAAFPKAWRKLDRRKLRGWM